MTKRLLMRDLTDEERLEYRKWARRVALCYGLIALLLFGAAAMYAPPNVAVIGAKDRTAAKPDLQIMRENVLQSVAGKDHTN